MNEKNTSGKALLKKWAGTDALLEMQANLRIR